MRPKLRPNEATCKHCKVVFSPKEKGQIYCTAQCFYAHGKKQNPVEWKCQQCAKTKIVTSSGDKKRKYCSRECAVIAARGKPKLMMNYFRKDKSKPCERCGSIFIAERVSNRYCSVKCSNDAQRVDRIAKHCKICSSIFTVLPHKVNRKNFCSDKCRRTWMQDEWEAGRIIRKVKPEDLKIRNISEHERGREQVKTSQAHRNWRKAVLKRDDNKCQECGNGDKLHVHHILEFALFPKERFNLNNGIVLCKTCHEKLHKNMSKRVGIIGLGWVGEFMNKQFPNALIYDPKHPEYHTKLQVNRYCDIAFICVPTPNLEDGSLDISIVEESVAWCECPIIVIRSTLNPGTADRLSTKYKKRIVVQPEYLGETFFHPLLDPKGRDFIILGGDSKDTQEVIGLYTQAYNANIKIRQVTAHQAEVIKLTENRAIAFKVAQCQELYDICEAYDVNYYTIRDAVFGDDPRFDLWFSFIYPNKRGMNSKCIPKDVYAWAAWAESVGGDASITRAILEKNKEWLALNVPEVEDEELSKIPTRAEIDLEKTKHEVAYEQSINGQSVYGERSSFRNDKWEKSWADANDKSKNNGNIGD